jgi:hypothetical protein
MYLVCKKKLNACWGVLDLREDFIFEYIDLTQLYYV